MSKISVSIVTLGCPKNQVDSEHLAASLQSPLLQVAHSDDFADVVMINTCGFIADAKEQSVDTILEYIEAKKQGKIKKLIVFGCMIQRYGEELKKELKEVDFWSGLGDQKEMLAFITDSAQHNQKRDKTNLSTPGHYAYLKISEGCDRQCSFCAIPGIRGKHISLPVEAILEEAKLLVSQGVKELIIIAQDTTWYGMDLYKKRMLPQLMETLAKESGAKWIRLQYTYPAGFPLELIDVMSRYSNICNYIDIPFQHVSDSILASMKRFHTQSDIEQLITYFRSQIPDIHIRSAFITGFPGEGRSEFNELAGFLKKHKLERVGFFAYSHEEGTPAGKLKETVSQAAKLRRMETLYAIQEKISMDLNLGKTGKEVEIIVDEVYDSYLLGRTEHDAPEIDHMVTVHVKKGHKYEPGQFIRVKITGADAWDLIAEPAE